MASGFLVSGENFDGEDGICKMVIRDIVRKDKEEVIIKAAAELFFQKGFEATSIREIAEMANIQAGSIYYYISSKEDLLIKIVERIHQQLIGNLDLLHNNDEDVLEKLRMAFRLHLKLIEQNGTEMSVALSETKKLSLEWRERTNKIREKYEIFIQEVLKEGVDLGVFKPHNIKIISFTFFALCNWSLRWFRSDGEISAIELADIYFWFFNSGIINNDSVKEQDLQKDKLLEEVQNLLIEEKGKYEMIIESITKQLESPKLE